MRGTSLLVIGLTLAACGDDAGSPDGGTLDAPVDGAAPDASTMPATLAETGLCADPACTQIAGDVHAYTPAYELWSDGATKRRWIYLPPGSRIDTSDMDYWQFPEGARLWKEFTRDGTRVETRLLLKTGPEPGDWFRAAYAWNAAGDEAPLADPAYGAENVLGTEHDIPTRSDCRKCHDQLAGGILGFGAIVLDHDGPGLTLDALAAMDWLSDPPPDAGYPIPGDAAARAALGYLHVNCGNCHNPTSTVVNMVPVDWRLRVGELGDVTATPPYQTAVGVAPTLGNVPGATAIVAPGAPAQSAAYLRVTTTESATQMPPIARERVDDAGAADLAAWIGALAGN